MPYFDHVLEADEGSRRAAVKLLTRTIEERLVELTINAPDWSVNT
jgi:glycerol-3-phosphate O-acyltransferase/dihydroxyacetone phosphate acyltransferase